MPPAAKSLEIYQGDDWSLILRLRTRDGSGTLGPYINLTGYTGKSQVRPSADSTTVAAEMTVTVDPDQVNNPGKITLALTNVQTAALSGAYVWDFQITDPQGLVTTYLAGNFVCDKQVTR